MDDQIPFINSFDAVIAPSSHSVLNSLVSISQGMNMQRQILDYKDILSEISQGIDANDQANIDEMNLFMDPEDIEEVNMINKYVQKGRNTLLQCLKEHQESVDKINKYDAQIYSLESAIKKLKEQIYVLEDMHDEFTSELMTSLVDEVESKKKTVLEELQALHGLEVINKDKLEAKIKALAISYNIIRSTPMVHICPVCFSNEVDVYNEPCGHTLCKTCSQSSGAYCHMCRMRVRSTRSIYYS